MKAIFKISDRILSGPIVAASISGLIGSALAHYSSSSTQKHPKAQQGQRSYEQGSQNSKVATRGATRYTPPKAGHFVHAELLYEGFLFEEQGGRH